jgi:hypothetical protein
MRCGALAVRQQNPLQNVVCVGVAAIERAQMSTRGRISGRQYLPRPTGPDLPSFPDLIAAARTSTEGSAAPLKYRQEVPSELQIIDRICGLARADIKTVLALVRRLVMVMDNFDPVAADGLRMWVNENHPGWS